MRKIIALIEIDENLADQDGMGALDYLEQEFCWMYESGIFLDSATIVDDDDEFDKEKVDFVRKFL